MELSVNIKRLNTKAKIPSYSREGDAGMDLTATGISYDIMKRQVTYTTGISLEIPYGYVGLLFPRSSICNYTLDMTNSVGVIDSGYRGELTAVFSIPSSTEKTKLYGIGDRIAQLMIVPYPRINFVESINLSESERGEGGYGSSGL